MAKKYETLKVETDTYSRFKRAKHGLEFQNDTEYTISEFVNILIDSIGKRIVTDINRMEKPKSQSHAS